MESNNKPITQTSFSTRLLHSGAFALASSVLIGVTQVISGEESEQVYKSAGTEFIQGYVSSFTNQTLYNWLKRTLKDNVSCDNAVIEYASAVLVSIFGVGVIKLLVHTYAHTTGAGYIAASYTLLNIIVMILYEKKVLQKDRGS